MSSVILHPQSSILDSPSLPISLSPCLSILGILVEPFDRSAETGMEDPIGLD
jgi:hypothetical protein